MGECAWGSVQEVDLRRYSISKMPIPLLVVGPNMNYS